MVEKLKWEIRKVSFIAIPSTAVVNGMTRRTRAFLSDRAGVARGHDKRDKGSKTYVYLNEQERTGTF
jgi:hypothetical protein